VYPVGPVTPLRRNFLHVQRTLPNYRHETRIAPVINPENFPKSSKEYTRAARAIILIKYYCQRLTVTGAHTHTPQAITVKFSVENLAFSFPPYFALIGAKTRSLGDENRKLDFWVNYTAPGGADSCNKAQRAASAPIITIRYKTFYVHPRVNPNPNPARFNAILDHNTSIPQISRMCTNTFLRYRANKQTDRQTATKTVPPDGGSN